MNNLSGPSTISIRYKGVADFIDSYETRLEESIQHIEADESNIDKIAKQLDLVPDDIRIFLGHDL